MARFIVDLKNWTSKRTKFPLNPGARAFHFRPIYQDCSAAIRLLPDSPKPGPFHTGGLADEFKLPVNKIIRTCEIEVRLVDAYTGGVMSTWREIRDAAAVVAETCYNGRGIETIKQYVLEKRLRSELVDSVQIEPCANEALAWCSSQPPNEAANFLRTLQFISSLEEFTYTTRTVQPKRADTTPLRKTLSKVELIT
ncbi:MAG: hypothetical protein Q9163_001028 [Psora crenata]